MSFMGKLFRFFDGHVETSDNHIDERLRTHYYKASKDKALKALEEIIRVNSMLSLIDVSRDRGEVAATTTKGKKGLLVITVITAGPFKTSVDISFSVDKGLLGSFGTQIINQFFTELDSQLTPIKM
jgi:hypothetical protein